MIRPESIQPVGGRECVQYREGGLTLLRLERHLPVGRLAGGHSPLFVIIPKNGDQRVGIVASSIVDIVETDVAVREYDGPHPGLAGLLNLDGRLTLMLRGEELLEVFRQNRPMVDAPLIPPGPGE
jgi:chemotaxis protein histidine kinase CheA